MIAQIVLEPKYGQALVYTNSSRISVKLFFTEYRQNIITLVIHVIVTIYIIIIHVSFTHTHTLFIGIYSIREKFYTIKHDIVCTVYTNQY